jgi:hypothetical protein
MWLFVLGDVMKYELSDRQVEILQDLIADDKIQMAEDGDVSFTSFVIELDELSEALDDGY